MLKVLDLFSGIGGFSLGLESTGGFETVAFCEIDDSCRRVLFKHWPKTYFFKDIRKLYKRTDMLEYGSGPVKTGYLGTSGINVICGGFPCQDVSVANIKGKGVKGERSGLWTEYLRLIKEIKPRWAIIENVANLRARGLATVLKDLDAIGYDSEFYIISAAAVGAPHRRERIWIIAYPNSTKLRLQPGGCERKDGQEATELRNNGETITNTVRPRLQGYLEKRIGLLSSEQKKITEFGDEKISSSGEFKNWYSRALRERDGVSNRVDRSRLKQLGNAVVPQIPKLIGEAILDYERRQDDK